MQKDNNTYVLVYPPSRRSLKEEYPELAEIKEFANCSISELKFAWYYAIFYSKALSEKKRIQKSYVNSFEKFTNDLTYEHYYSGDFPEHVREAILKFNTYNVDARFKAKLTAERALKNLQAIADVDLDTLDDWDLKKKYADTVITIVKELPGLISQVEMGYGLKEVKFSRDSYLQPDIDLWHEKKKS